MGRFARDRPSRAPLQLWGVKRTVDFSASANLHNARYEPSAPRNNTADDAFSWDLSLLKNQAAPHLRTRQGTHHVAAVEYNPENRTEANQNTIRSDGEREGSGPLGSGRGVSTS
eukprot:scaffold24005_cov59-Phaeocystis_antarctica.AAC.2